MATDAAQLPTWLPWTPPLFAVATGVAVDLGLTYTAAALGVALGWSLWVLWMAGRDAEA